MPSNAKKTFLMIATSLCGALIFMVGCASSMNHVPGTPIAGPIVETYSADKFVACAACHLADGVGVPGAFPPIRNRAAAIASTDRGREYLITTVSYGLMGAMEVESTQYFGMMPGSAAIMSAKDISASLNYLVFELVDEQPVTSITAFTDEEVLATQKRVKSRNPSVAMQLRKALIENAGSDWPY